ncbi:MAG: DUF1559 domain-containing protein, partial [Pirellulaceae bacterium]|nr:DUF1559 domain-containing protein [Pirellulaceae bacterium]
TGVSVTLGDIRNGTSNTLLFSENLIAELWTSYDQGGLYSTFVWLYVASDNPPVFDNNRISSAPNSAPSPMMRINGERTVYLAFEDLGSDYNQIVEGLRPSSNHPGGVNVIFADSHGRFITDEIDYHVYQHLMTPNGDASDMPYRKTYVLQAKDFE